jgi:hypothetical protein
MPSPTACFHSELVNTPRIKRYRGQCRAGLLVQLFSLGSTFNVARGPPLTPSHVRGNAITRCDVAVVDSSSLLLLLLLSLPSRCKPADRNLCILWPCLIFTAAHRSAPSSPSMPFRACTCRKDNHNTHPEFRPSTPRLRIEIELCVCDGGVLSAPPPPLPPPEPT